LCVSIITVDTEVYHEIERSIVIRAIVAAVLAGAVSLGCGQGDDKGKPAPVAAPTAAHAPSPRSAPAVPPGWTAETKTVKATTPTRHQERQITYYSNTINMKLVSIPAGEFMMGSPDTEEYRHVREAPQHKVRITRPFFMGAYEVTQEQYEKVMGSNPAHYPNADNPVEEVTWGDAVEFCRRLSEREGGESMEYRLPTEAEWEYACRAGTTTPFYTGATISTEEANYNGNHA